MQVKGTALASIPKFVRKNHGKEGLELWLSKLAPEVRTIFEETLKESAWYPLKELVVTPTAVFCQLFYNWDYKGAWELGRYSADQGLRGINRLSIKFVSPEVLINKAITLLPSYYTPSTLEVVENRENLAVVRITEFPEIDKVIEYRIGGWMEAALEMSGCWNIMVEMTKAMTRNAPFTEYRMTWERG
jgi:hypothetical protein